MTEFREGRKWDEDKALTFLATQGIKPIERVIELNRSDAPGLKSWGAMDFLRHYCKYEVKRER